MPFDAARARLDRADVLDAGERLAEALDEARKAGDSLLSIGAIREAERARALCNRLERTHTRSHRPDSATSDLDRLTTREREVLKLVCEGLSNQAIAQRLGLSGHTVHRHVSNILTKLDLPSRAAAAALAGRSGSL
jgi:RNA polymerase sigma factor (sigma-70 family)